MHTVQPGYSDFPQRHADPADVQRASSTAFPAGPTPAQVVIQAATHGSAQFAAALGQFRTRGSRTPAPGVQPDLRSPIDAARRPHLGAARRRRRGRRRSDDALATLREQVIPATLRRRASSTVAVGGETAGPSDYNETLRSHVPLVFAFVLALAFLLLLVTFRSIVIALKAIVLNLLSVGAAYGFLVAVFQWGWGEHILGFQSTGGITAWIPLFLFVVLFGLSMDYHVFILSRIREAVDRGMRPRTLSATASDRPPAWSPAPRWSWSSCSRIFGSLSQVSMKEIGIGLAFAVLLDATIVRAVLLPAIDEAPRRVELVAPEEARLAAPVASKARHRAIGWSVSSAVTAGRRWAVAHRGGPAVQRLVFGSLAPLVQLDIESTYELSGRRTAYRCFSGTAGGQPRWPA